MRVSWRERLRPRLRTVLVAVNLLVLLLPLAGIGVLRLYESELVRRTEAELIGQAALVAEAYGQAVRGAMAQGIGQGTSFGVGADPRFLPRKDAHLTPRSPRLDRSRTTLQPDNPAARRGRGRDHPVAEAAGAALGGVLQRATRTTLSAIRVVGPRGYVVATSRAARGAWLGHWPEVARGLKGEQTAFLRRRHSAHFSPSLRSVSRGTPVRVFVGHPVLADEKVWGVVVLSRTPLDVAKALYLNRRELAGGLLVLLAVVGLIAFLTSRLIARPLRDLQLQAERVARAERGPIPPIPHKGTREVAALSQAISAMAEALQGRATYLEAFAQNVSHAFKTPLTAIRGTVELLQDHLDTMSQGERARFLGNLDAEAARLERLVRRLMVLARADVLEPGAERCDLASELGAIVARHGEGVRLDEPAEPMQVALAAETLDAIVDNLIENALRHGAAPVTVTVHAADSAAILVRVADAGPGVSPEVADTLFDPFVTTAGGAGGTGLGLAIVRALARAHGGEVRFLPGDGACFEVSLPRA